MRKVTDIAVGLKRQGKKSARKHSQIVNMEVVNHCFPRVPDIFLLARGGYAEASWFQFTRIHGIPGHLWIVFRKVS